jgi:hypothetical protein
MSQIKPHNIAVLEGGGSCRPMSADVRKRHGGLHLDNLREGVANAAGGTDGIPAEVKTIGQ